MGLSVIISILTLVITLVTKSHDPVSRTGRARKDRTHQGRAGHAKEREPPSQVGGRILGFRVLRALELRPSTPNPSPYINPHTTSTKCITP